MNSRVSRCLAGVWLAVVACTGAVAQDGAASQAIPLIAQWRRELITTADGLPSDLVYAVARDSVGFLWVGTRDGLARRDARHVVVLRHDDRDLRTLSTNFVRALNVARDGTLWIGTDRGLNCLARGSVHVQRTCAVHSGTAIEDSLLASDVVRAVLEARNGDMWVATARGVVRIAAGTGRVTRFSSGIGTGLPSDRVQALAEGLDGSVWIGTTAGLARAISSATGWSIDSIPIPGASRGRAIERLAVGRDGDLWIATNGAGLLHRNAVSGLLVQYAADARSPRALPNDVVGAVLITRRASDARERVWAGTNDGLVVIERENAPVGRVQLSRATEPMRVSPTGAGRRDDGAAASAVMTIADCGDDVVCIGTFARGLLLLAEPSHDFRSIPLVENAPVLAVLAEDTALWAGTPNGLLELGPDWRVRHRFGTREPPSRRLRGDVVTALHRSRDGTLWIGSTAGFDRLVEGRVEKQRLSDSLRTGAVFAIDDDTVTGRVILGSDNGLAYVSIHDDIMQRAAGTFDPRVRSPVRALQRRADGTLLVGTDGGLLTIRGSDAPAAVPDLAEPIRAVRNAPDGTVWIGTASGVRRWHPSSGVIDTVDERHGLPRGEIASILLDRAGNVWAATAGNVSKITVRRDSSPRVAVSVQRFDESEGLPFAAFAARSASGGGPDAALYFGSGRGLLRIAPNASRTSVTPPRFAVTEIRRMNRPLPVDSLPPAMRELVLGPDDAMFSIEATSLALVPQPRQSLAYRLIGHDPVWRVSDGQSMLASWTRVPAGRYTLDVRAAADTLLGNQLALLSLPIMIRPPWWRTMTFYFACVLAALSLLVIAWRRREARLRQRFELVMSERLAERTRVAGELHDTLLQGFTGIALQLKALANRSSATAPEKTGDALNELLSVAQRTLTEARHAVWDLRAPSLENGSGNAHALVSAIRQATQSDETAPLLERVVIVGAERPLPHDVEGNLLRIVEQALANARMHAAARHIDVHVRFESASVIVRIVDDGIGFDPAQVANGRLGLLGMRERMARIGGTLTIEATRGRGTVIMARVSA